MTAYCIINTDFITAEADRKILLALLRDPNLTANIDWDGLAAELSTTVGALKKRISRIKIAAKENNEYVLTNETLSNRTDFQVQR